MICSALESSSYFYQNLKTDLFMKQSIATLVLIFYASPLFSQTSIKYDIAFDNAVHHEAEIGILFNNLTDNVLEVRMSRSSPGRYALHEFAKNVYDVHAYDSHGNKLEITRPNPYQWNVSGHDGTVRFEYTLFANHGDGTYSQVDETHAHLNIPSTFAWARNYEHRPVKVTFDVRDDLNWEIATQLKHIESSTYYAPDLYYFMDSPTEIADLHFRETTIEGKKIRLALHSSAKDWEVDEYFDKVISIVKAESNVFGGLPDFDYGEYTFLSCYMPNASGDGMEHRNSTYVVSSKPLSRPIGETSISTISHEFLHSWNVERMRPRSLEPFNFEKANMSGELWFAEGFTQYYTDLNLVRAGILDAETYINELGQTVGYVINAPGRKFFNPIEMSYQAPFVDAAISIDPQNKSNTFISYYTYGDVIGLALDLSLRETENNLNLDDFMKLFWKNTVKLKYRTQSLISKMRLQIMQEKNSPTISLKNIYLTARCRITNYFSQRWELSLKKKIPGNLHPEHPSKLIMELEGWFLMLQLVLLYIKLELKKKMKLYR